MNPTPSSAPYRAFAGQAYFAYQNPHGQKRGGLNRLKVEKHIHPEDRVLDFGCGGGWLLRALDCAEKTGVEINPAAHDLCRENGVEVVERLEDLEDRVFDVALSHHSLEHVANPHGVLESLRSRLKPEGELILVVPIDDWRNRRRIKLRDPNHHLYTWTPQLLFNLLRAAGYESIDVRIHSRAWFPGWHRVVDRVPLPLFSLLCAIWSRLIRGRELIAVAGNPGPGS